MNVTYKEAVSSNKNQYRVELEYEHGDADFTTHNTFILENATEEDVIDFVKRVNEARKHIENNRYYSTPFPENFLELTKDRNAKYRFELEYDEKYSDLSDYYANMRVDNILYYNESGTKFFVTVDNDA